MERQKNREGRQEMNLGFERGAFSRKTQAEKGEGGQDSARGGDNSERGSGFGFRSQNTPR